MSKVVGLNRRTFIKGAGMTALAGAAGTVSTVSNTASAQSSSHIARLRDGRFDFDTPYNRVGTNCSRWDSPARKYPPGVFKYGMGVASMDFECAP